jgi:DNA-binding response OmpR family regulator
MDEKIRILIVEDEAPIANLLTTLLTRAGYSAQIASNGKTGLSLATTESFNLIMLDVDLPDMTGIEICHELKQRHFSNKTPIVLMSGKATPERRQKGFENGADDFIAKPFTVEHFLERVQHFTSGGFGKADGAHTHANHP